MKNFLFVLVAFLTLNIFIPEVSVAGDFGAGLWDMVTGVGVVPDGEFLLPCPEEFNEIGQYASARTYIIKVLNFALSFLGLIAMIFIIYAGILYVTAGGDDGQHEKAKKIIIYASTGILVVLVSFALVNTLIRSAPSGDDDRGGPGGATYSGEGTIVPDYCRQLGSEAPEVEPIEINVSPGASFGSGYMVSLEQAQNLSFQTSMDGEWNFGDGMMGSGQNATHSYGERGAYEVYFLAKDEEGQFYGAKTVIVVDGVMADFSADKYELPANEEVTLNGQASKSAVGSIIGYAWSCDPTCSIDDTTASVTTASFPSDGNYDVTLIVTSSVGTGATGSVTKMFTVLKALPEAVIVTPIETTGRERHPAEYIFDGAGSENIYGTPMGLKYVWDFGDGTGEHIFNTQTVTHEYTEPGDKNVTLKVSYSHQGKVLESDPVTANISDVSTLWVDFTAPQFLTIDEEFMFQAQSPEGVTYLWDLDGGSTIDELTFPSVRATFDEAKIYNVKLTVTDAGMSEFIVYPVYVRAEGDPTAIAQYFSIDTWINVPSTITTTRDGSGATDILIQSNSIDSTGDEGCGVANLNYSWSVDGAPVSTDCEPDLNQYFAEAETYPVTLLVYDPDNQNIQDSASFTVDVENILPIISSFVYETNTNPDPIPEGPVSFFVTATASDPDTNNPITSYKFEAIENGQVKDVQLLGTGEAYFNLSQYNGIHTFSFRVTATDGENGATTEIGMETYTFQNVIANEPPVITSSLQASKTGILEGEDVIFSVVATDPEGETLEYEWKVTDPSGQFVTATTEVGTYEHQFTTAGNYSVRVKVSDGINEVQSGPVTIQVAAVFNNPPQAGQLQVGGSATKPLGSTFNFEVEASDPDGDDLDYVWTAKNLETLAPVTIIPSDETATFIPTEIGSYKITVEISDLDENGIIKDTIERTKNVNVTTNSNQPPVITSSLVASETEIIIGEAVTFSVVANDPEGETLEYEWKVTGPSGQFVTATTEVDTYTHTFTAAGNYSVRVKISDGINEIQSGPVMIQVTTEIPNQPPVITEQLISDPVSPVVVDTEVIFSIVASDPDNDSLTYEWIINNNSIFTGTDASYVHTFTEVGDSSVQVKVSDGIETILSDIIIMNVIP